MNNLNKLIEAVESRTPIAFTYNKPGKIIGERVGNVHAIFILELKNGVKSTKIHIVQTEGVSDSASKDNLPNFRMFDITDINDITILSDRPQFEIFNESYNPEWKGYSNTIAKV